MKLRQWCMVLLLWAGSALGSNGHFEMTSTLQLAGQASKPLFAWCNAPSGVFALTQPQGKAAQLYRWHKRGGVLTSPNVQRVTMQDSDGAAGSVFYPFGEGNYVRISNIENTLDPAYHMTRVGEFSLGGVTHRCGYAKDATFMGVTRRRSVTIWINGMAATYATQNFNGRAGVRVGGRAIPQGWEFTAPQGYRYRVMQAVSGWQLQVWQGKRRLQTEPFEVYSVSSWMGPEE